MRRRAELAQWFTGPSRTVVYMDIDDSEIFAFESTWYDKGDFWLFGDLVESYQSERYQSSQQE